MCEGIFFLKVRMSFLLEMIGGGVLFLKMSEVGLLVFLDLEKSFLVKLLRFCEVLLLLCGRGCYFLLSWMCMLDVCG